MKSGEPFRVVAIGTTFRDRLSCRSREEPDCLFLSTVRPCFARGGIVMECPRREAMVLLAVAGRLGEVCLHEDLVNLLGGDQEDGGPESILKIVDIMIFRVRPMAAALGVGIRSLHGLGFYALDLRTARMVA